MLVVLDTIPLWSLVLSSFFVQVERSFKDALTAHSNLAVSMYRMGNAERTNAKKKRSLMTTAYHAIHHNVQKLDSNNHAILNYMDVSCSQHRT